MRNSDFTGALSLRFLLLLLFMPWGLGTEFGFFLWVSGGRRVRGVRRADGTQGIQEPGDMMSQFGEPSADIDDRAGMCGGVVFFFPGRLCALAE